MCLPIIQKLLQHQIISYWSSRTWVPKIIKSFQLSIYVIPICSLPLGNCLFIWNGLQRKEMLAMESSAQIQMRVQLILKLSFHEFHSVECLFIFNKCKDLDNSNFGQFDVFHKLVVENQRSKNPMPKLGKRIEIIFFTQDRFKIMTHGHLEKKALQI